MLHRQSKPYMLEAATLVVHETIGGTAVARVTVITTSAYDQEIAGRLAVRRLAVPVSTPFPYVPSHVV